MQGLLLSRERQYFPAARTTNRCARKRNSGAAKTATQAPGHQEKWHRRERQRVLGVAQAQDLTRRDPITQPDWSEAGVGMGGAISLRPRPDVPGKASHFHTAEPRGGHGMSQQGHRQTVKTFSSVEEREPLAAFLASADVVYI